MKVFSAATSSYGVSDLRKLYEFTHKFESKYLSKLLGGTPEEIPEVFKARSPIYHVDNIASPLLASKCFLNSFRVLTLPLLIDLARRH